MSSKISTSIAILGEDLDFAECSAAIGLKPTMEFVRKFDSMVVPKHQWILKCEKQIFESTDDALKELFRKLSGVENRILAYARQHDYRIKISCNVTIREDRPVYELKMETVQKIAQLGASFGMDIF